MRVFVCTDHDGYWPVSTASVVIAEDEGQARRLLSKALAEQSLESTVFTLREIPAEKAAAYILCDGNY